MFGWLLVFAAFFLFLVLFPYLSIQHELQTIPGEIRVLRNDIAARGARIDAYHASEKGFERQLARSSTFWRTVDGKGDFFVEVEENIEGFWRDYEEVVKS